MPERYELLENWLDTVFDKEKYVLTKLAGDASFRCYYRVQTTTKSYILMDAPPNQECCESFVAIDGLLSSKGIHAPEIFHQNQKDGFLLLEDFGDDVLLKILSPKNADENYKKAIDIICLMQKIQHTAQIPTFDYTFIQQELNLFKTWFLEKLLVYTLPDNEAKIIDNFFHHLAEQIMQQPYVFIHRDFHARNLMSLSTGELGVLDFQDPMLGPISYDLVSLLKDAYISWPRQKQELWLSYYHNQVLKQGILNNYALGQLYNDFDIIGLQRHIKIIGIFSRLAIRDGKTQYLNDIPRVLHYTLDALTRIELYHDVYQLFTKKLQPLFENHQ